jgi:hypothetical protein
MTDSLRQHHYGLIFDWIATTIFLVVLAGSSSWFIWHESALPDSSKCKRTSQASLPTLQNIPGETNQQVKPNLQTGLPASNLISNNINSKAGFGLADNADPLFWAEQLNSGWYLDWRTDQRRNFQYPEHWQMIRLFPGCVVPSNEATRWLVLHYPGQTWIIGNEPDVILQDAVTAEQYAQMYHELYYLIKSTDPTARVAVAGVAQPSPLRLEYLDHVLAAYQNSYHEQMPVDWWTVHGYVLREERDSWGVDIPPGMTANQGQLYEVEDNGRMDLFIQQIQAFRSWMARHGYRQVPLALTEFGIVMPADYGFPVAVKQQYLRDTFQWLATAIDAATGLPQDGNRLVQRWAWFSLSYSPIPDANLADLEAGKLTPIGETFRDFISGYHP